MLSYLDFLDFLPKDFNPFLKGFIYVLILVHILAFVFWCVVACPSMFKRPDSFSDKVEKMIQQNKEKRL